VLNLIKCAALVVVSLTLFFWTGRATAVALHKLNPLFETALPALHGHTNVPLRLPRLVLLYDPTQQLYARANTVDANHYQVVLSYAPDCSAQACYAGSVLGEMASGGIDTSDSISVRNVTLKHKAQATIVTPRCGASCEPPSITWDEGPFRYSISLGASDDMLIDMANSMTAY